MSNEIIITGRWTLDALDSLLKKSSMIQGVGSRIDFVSGHFLGTPYKENTLMGSMDAPEIFIINLESVDCFTFIEYVEAMRLSGSFAEFKQTLQKIRYQKATVDYQKRNHFFTDWYQYNSGFVKDITAQIGAHNTVVMEKVLNLKEDKTSFLPGIVPAIRKVRYIPSIYMNDETIAKLKTGDYIGIYTDKAGLDVSHVGIFIQQSNMKVFRHASSVKTTAKVIDQDFKKYIVGKTGIVVLRPRRTNN